MIAYTRKASRQVEELYWHYEALGRVEASRALDAALVAAERLIADGNAAWLPHPRPYPGLAKPGRRWIKSGRYWVAYRATAPLAIVGVFYDSSDILGRL